MATCVWCKSSLPDGEAVCRYCGTSQSGAGSYKVGDRIRIRNIYKGNRVETVTITKVDRNGTGLEVRDAKGLVWGFIHPKDVLGSDKSA